MKPSTAVDDARPGYGLRASLALAMGWGLGWSLAWDVVASLTVGMRDLSMSMRTGFYITGILAALASAQGIPRLSSSLRLLAITGVLGSSAALFASTNKGLGAWSEFFYIVILVLPPMLVVRLLMDLFARRRSRLVRALVAVIGVPIILRACLALVSFVGSRGMNLNQRDLMIIVSLGVMGMTLVPPARISARSQD